MKHITQLSWSWVLEHPGTFLAFREKRCPPMLLRSPEPWDQSQKSKMKQLLLQNQIFAYLEAESLIDIFPWDLLWSSNWSTSFLNPPLLLGKFPYDSFSLDCQKSKLSKGATNTSCSKVKSPNFRWVSTRNLGNWKDLEGLMVGKLWMSHTRNMSPGFLGTKPFWHLWFLENGLL